MVSKSEASGIPTTQPEEGRSPHASASPEGSSTPAEQSSSTVDTAEPTGNPDLWLSSYDYHLPPERIAQNPVTPRDSSRLLVVVSPDQHQHTIFRDLSALLRPGDLLVMNNTYVIPARLYGRTAGGAKIEILLLEEKGQNQWLALVKPGRRLKPGTHVQFDPRNQGDQPVPVQNLTAVVLDRDEATSGRVLEFNLPPDQSLLQVIHHFGHVPLPPYITESEALPERYQTVYAEQPGSVAAPTAGLHFTPELLARLKEKGIQQAFVTLHVGVGTFRPVEVEKITDHAMHGEWVEISSEVVAQIQTTQANGGRIIAVGTTVTRALEGVVQDGGLRPYCGKTNLFIYPGYQWQVIEGLITNFHLPKSSLMMLVSALIGRQRLLALYEEAIAQQYRFYSFGDAMLILPEAKIA